jgi:uncharacterized protein involved in exopolysaccharide biosynthesis
MTQDRQFTPRDQEDDLTLRDLILAARSYRREAFRHWWVFLLAFLLIGGFLLYRALSTPVTYQAKLTFMVNEDEGGGLGGVSSVLGSLGLGRGRAGRYNLDKIVELARSRRIIQEVLLAPYQDSTIANSIGNAFIAEYKFDEQWAKTDPEMEGFRFTRDSVPAFDLRERKTLLALHGLLIGGEKKDGLVSATYDDQSGILTLTSTTTNEELSVVTARTLFEKLGKFYIDQAIERQQKTYEVVRAKVDSIAAELSKADVGLAIYADASNNLFSRVDQVKGVRLQRDIAKLSAMQAEAVKNMEYAEFMVKNARPVIQELDIPIAPLQPLQPSRLKALILGAAIAFVLASLYIIGRQTWRTAMRDG